MTIASIRARRARVQHRPQPAPLTTLPLASGAKPTWFPNGIGGDISASDASGAGARPDTLNINGGDGLQGASGGSVAINGGNSDDLGGYGGNALLQAGGTNGGNGGIAGVLGGNSTGVSGVGGNGGMIEIYGGGAANAGTGGIGGMVDIMGGDGYGAGQHGGDVRIQPGAGGNAATNGHVLMLRLPTADPHIVNALWVDAASANVLKVSQG